MTVNLVCVTEGRGQRGGSNPCHDVVAVVAKARGIAPAHMLSPTRLSPRIAAARQLAMYLSHVLLGMTMTDVGRFFGRDRTTVAHACALMEDSREDPLVDGEIEALEMRICSGLAPAALPVSFLEPGHASR